MADHQLQAKMSNSKNKTNKDRTVERDWNRKIWETIVILLLQSLRLDRRREFV